MIKSLTIADRLIEMMNAYESADYVKAQALGESISRKMHQEAGALMKSHLIQPTPMVVFRMNNGKFVIKSTIKTNKYVLQLIRCC